MRTVRLVRMMTRLGGKAGVLIALPFPLLMWATEAEVTTEVAPNGAGYQRVEIAFPADRAKPAERTRDLEHAFPRSAGWKTPWTQKRGGDVLLITDKRQGGIGRYEDASLERKSSWLAFWTVYEFRQQVKIAGRTEYEQRGAAPVVYRLKMPGMTVSSNADVQQKGKDVWLEWQIPAGGEPVTVEAQSKVFRAGYTTLLGFLGLWCLGWALRTFFRWRRAQPRRI
jgi:hypothetical protein